MKFSLNRSKQNRFNISYALANVLFDIGVTPDLLTKTENDLCVLLCLLKLFVDITFKNMILQRQL